MIFHQHYLGCLSHASYLIGDESTGRAVVVDPQRDVSVYLADLEADSLRLERVIETHFHADFVSGHLELAARTGATIWYGEPAEADFPIGRLHDGERISLGEVELEVLATPGHTPESISLLVYAHRGDAVPHAVLTGDTLFIGDVGRPDLAATAGLRRDDMARALYRSLREKLLPLADTTLVYPAHGAGSACGRNLSTQTSSTIGEQRRDNYALAPMSEAAFVALVTEGQPAAPAYFAFDARRNHQLHELLGEDQAPTALSLATVLDMQRAGAAVLDTRSAADFARGHLRGAINVGLEGRFAEYAGDVVRPERSIVLLCDAGTELEARVRLGRIGFDNVAGCVRDPMLVMAENPDAVVQSSRLSAAELARRRDAIDGLVVLDVRNPGELGGGAVPGSVSIPLAQLLDRLGELDPARPTVAYCAGGYRSSIAASLLAAEAFTDVSDLLGGYEAWTAAAPAQLA